MQTVRNSLGMVIIEAGVNWREYFYAFLERHGVPVQYNGRLLFADAWTYSASDYRGPEMPPPTDHLEVRKLKLAYWNERRKDTTELIAQHYRALQRLKALSEARSIPLVFAGGVTNPVAEHENWIATYREVVQECDKMLRELA